MTEYDLGVEKEYALIGEAEGLVGYCLGMEHVLSALENDEAISPDVREELKQLKASGWLVEPEYSKCLVEVVSPPFSPEERQKLIAGYEVFEESLRQAAAWVKECETTGFDEIRLGDSYGSITNQFFSTRAEPVEDWSEILLASKKSKSIVELAKSRVKEIPEIHGSPEAAARIFAGFTSTHITIRRFGFHDNCGSELIVGKDIAQALWKTLGVALEANEKIQTDKMFYPDGATPVDCGTAPREVFLKWMDHLGNQMKAGAHSAAAMNQEAALDLFRDVYGEGPFTDAVFDEKRFRNYACRPRIINGNLLFEFRCFDGAMNARTAFDTAESIVRSWKIGE